MKNAIEVKNLAKNYPDFTLRDVSFAVPEGTILGLVGENGAGKSTIINLLMGAVPRDGGSVSVLGCDPAAAEFVKVKQDIGVVLDESYFPLSLCARDAAKIMATCYLNWSDDDFYGYLRKLNLPEKKAFQDYSRGMRMKLAIAVALSHGAKLLLLDEATGGLDPMARDEILEILNDFTRAEDHSIIFSSHIVSDLEKACDSIAFIHRGQMMFCEEKDALMEDYALLKISHGDYEAVPREAVISHRDGPYGVEALVKRDMVTQALPREHANLEDLILFFAKGADNQ